MLSKTAGRLVALFFMASVLLGAMLPSAAAADIQVSAEACVLMEPESGEVIYAKNADRRMRIASTTKIMTALVVLEHCLLEESVEISGEWAAVEGSSMGLRAGEVCSVRELLYGLLLASGNDAATALACHTAGSVEAFADLMNARAAELGMNGTHFTNPHGLDDEEHYSTALDMAVLAAAALENADLALIVSTEEVRLSPKRYFANHNKLLWQCPGCIGLKTGYTSRAGRTLVSACERNGFCLVCVTLCDGDDWADHTALYEWGFENYEYRTAVNAGDTLARVPVVSAEMAELEVKAGAAVNVLVQKEAEISTEPSLPRFVYAPIACGEQLGWLDVCIDGEKIARVPLVAAQDAPVAAGEQLSFWERMKYALR